MTSLSIYRIFLKFKEGLIYIYIYIDIIQVIFTSEAKRVLYRKGADTPVGGQLNEGTWILIQICFVDQHGVGPLIS